MFPRQKNKILKSQVNQNNNASISKSECTREVISQVVSNVQQRGYSKTVKTTLGASEVSANMQHKQIGSSKAHQNSANTNPH